jgi:hypothetical protein
METNALGGLSPRPNLMALFERSGHQAVARQLPPELTSHRSNVLLSAGAVAASATKQCDELAVTATLRPSETLSILPLLPERTSLIGLLRSCQCAVKPPSTVSGPSVTGGPPSHSITSSARDNRAGGRWTPNAFAVLRLISSSNFVG